MYGLGITSQSDYNKDGLIFGMASGLDVDDENYSSISLGKQWRLGESSIFFTLGLSINYAKENEMILVTRDTESGQACEENNLPCILLDNNEIFKLVVEKLKNF